MKKISILIVFVLSLTACEDVLDLTPTDSLSDADFWANETTIQGYVDYANHMLGGHYWNGRPAAWGHFRGEATDEAFAHVGIGGGLNLTNGCLLHHQFIFHHRHGEPKTRVRYTGHHSYPG